MKIRVADPEVRSEVLDLLATRGWADGFDPDRGRVYVAWDDAVVGCLQLVEIDDETAVLDVVLVDEARRREGVGSALVTAATSDRVGPVFVSCREDGVAFYEHLGFSVLEGGVEGAPPRVRGYWREAGNRAPLAMIRASRKPS